MPEKVGVYICHCGTNIAKTVDVEEVARWAGEQENVEIARDYKFKIKPAIIMSFEE